MYEVTEFYIQPADGSAFRLPNERDPNAAAREAERLARRGGEVLLFSVKGWPRFDIWDRPRLVARFNSGEKRPPGR